MHHMTKKLTTLAMFTALILFPATWALAGSLDSPAAPTDAGSAMYTLEDIYNRLNNNTQATKRAGGFAEPNAGPASTGKTLDQVYEKALPTQVPKTGQTTCWDQDGNSIGCAGTGQDGDLLRGVAWPNPRFTDNGDGTVTDNLTGLVWLKNASCFGSGFWSTAMAIANGLKNGEKCGTANAVLTDGSEAGDWRLPNVRELQSLVDYGRFNPALPSGHPFTGVQSSFYWSSTTIAGEAGHAWYVRMNRGLLGTEEKYGLNFVWPVRDGQ